MSTKIILFEDTKEYGDALQSALRSKLGQSSDVHLFTPPAESPTGGVYEERLARDLSQPPYDGAKLVVADRDLSKTPSYGGLSESTVKRAADSLALPECAYARGESEEDFLRATELREARIVVSLKEGGDKFAEQVASIAEGFDRISQRLADALAAPGKKSPGKLLAHILDKPEYADKISLYASGDQNRLAAALRIRGGDADGLRRLMCLMGYWLWDSVLRFPGVVVNEIAASSYLNVRENEFSAGDVKALFQDAEYSGPFSKAKGELWWRGILDDIVANSGCRDGREFTEKKLGRTIQQSQCCEDLAKPGGYYCMLSRKPVSLENSKGGLSWFPRGADLARVSISKYEELAPWL